MSSVGRNAPCPCGSGKKFKNCCLRNKPTIQPIANQTTDRDFQADMPSHQVPSRAKTGCSAAQVQQTFAMAVAFYQKGQIAQAQSLCELVLQAQPKMFDALHMMGLIAFQTKSYD